MELSRRDLLKSALAAPLCYAVPLAAPAVAVGSVAVQDELSDWDWPPHSPGDCIVFRQRLHISPAPQLIRELHSVNCVSWRGCAARTVRIERLEASLMTDDSWRLLRFVRHDPGTFDLKFMDANFPETGFKALCIHSQIIFQSIDFGQMWQPWDGTWA